MAKNGYFIDKTQYIERLEEIENPVFLRPRRFGKSLLCRILECYYSIHQKDRFEELFGNTWIGNNPTPLKNAFIVLHLDFSTIELGKNVDTIRTNFNQVCNGKADNSFLKTFFKTLKEGRKTGAIANVFITGVLPVTMDELASAFNFRQPPKPNIIQHVIQFFPGRPQETPFFHTLLSFLCKPAMGKKPNPQRF